MSGVKFWILRTIVIAQLLLLLQFVCKSLKFYNSHLALILVLGKYFVLFFPTLRLTTYDTTYALVQCRLSLVGRYLLKVYRTHITHTPLEMAHVLLLYYYYYLFSFNQSSSHAAQSSVLHAYRHICNISRHEVSWKLRSPPKRNITRRDCEHSIHMECLYIAAAAQYTMRWTIETERDFNTQVGSLPCWTQQDKDAPQFHVSIFKILENI